MTDTCEKHCEATAFKIVIRGLEVEVASLKEAWAQPEQEPVGSVVRWVDGSLIHGWFGDPPPEGTLLYAHPPQRTEQEPVAWPCLIDSANFSENTITLVMQCEDYKVSAGTHWLSTTPPKENT